MEIGINSIKAAELAGKLLSTRRFSFIFLKNTVVVTFLLGASTALVQNRAIVFQKENVRQLHNSGQEVKKKGKSHGHLGDIRRKIIFKTQPISG